MPVCNGQREFELLSEIEMRRARPSSDKARMAALQLLQEFYRRRRTPHVKTTRDGGDCACSKVCAQLMARETRNDLHISPSCALSVVPLILTREARQRALAEVRQDLQHLGAVVIQLRRTHTGHAEQPREIRGHSFGDIHERRVAEDDVRRHFVLAGTV